jgi:uncharacterized protein (TIGR03083 family)
VAPAQHIEWFEHSIDWFEQIVVDELALDVPNCPGWTIETVVNHLSYGLGVAYPVAMAKQPDTADSSAFDGTEWPETYPTGSRALQSFTANMRSCLAAFEQVDPEREAYTFAGPGRAKFWMRRAAIETELHRLDVEDALSARRVKVPAERIADGVAETIEFALPLAARLAGEPPGAMSVSMPDLGLRMKVGAGPSRAELRGLGVDVLNALWGRPGESIEVVGDQAIAASWLSVIDEAFADR